MLQAQAADKETRLIRRYTHAADPRDRKTAQHAIVEAYLPLARKLAHRYRGRQIDVEDLEQVAFLGLVKAIERFRPELGYAFGAFAVPTILGELRRHFRDHGWSVHVPRGIQELSQVVNDANEQSWSERGRACSIDELAERLEKTPTQIQEALLAWDAYAPGSLQAPAPGSEDGEPLQIADRRLEFVDEVIDLVTLADAFQQLPEPHQQMLEWYFRDELPQSKIALAIGVSQMQVSRRIKKALDILRGLAEHPNQPEEVTDMAKRSELYRSPAEIAKVTTLLEENGGRLTGDSVMADLVRATGRKASELNGLLAEMSGKNLVRRRFGDKSRLVELALVKSVQGIGEQAQDEPAAAADPEGASSAPASPPSIPDRLRQLVAKVDLHGEGGVVVASGMEQAAEILGYSRQTLAGYVSESKKRGLLDTEHRRGRYVIRLADAPEVAPPPIAQQSTNGASPATPVAGGLVSLLRAAADRIEAVEHENARLQEQVERLGTQLNGAGRLQACA